jgi:hypothetical protein
MGSRESCGELFDGMLGSSVSVSEPSRSQLSATGLDLGLWAGFWGLVVDSLRCVRVDAISAQLLARARCCRVTSRRRTFFARCFVNGCHVVFLLCVVVV